MLTLEALQEKLKAHPNLSEIANEIQVTRSYLSALANGVRVNPSYNMIKKLSDYFEEKEL